MTCDFPNLYFRCTNPATEHVIHSGKIRRCCARCAGFAKRAQKRLMRRSA